MEDEDYSNKMTSTKEVMEEMAVQLNGFDPITSKGFTMVPNALLEDPALSLKAKMVYAFHLKYAWEKDRVWPGQKKLGKYLGRSEAWVSQGVNELKEAGWMSSKRRGLGKTNITVLHSRVQKDKTISGPKDVEKDDD